MEIIDSLATINFQDNLIIINHLHRPSLVRSECAPGLAAVG